MFLDDLSTDGGRSMQAVVDDAILFTRELGVLAARGQQHVTWWHGDADHIVPLAHAQHIVPMFPDAELRIRHGESHLGGLGAAHEVLQTDHGRIQGMTAYVLVEIAVTDPEAFETYRALSTTALDVNGGHYLARGGATELLEGDGEPGRVVLLEFPDADAARPVVRLARVPGGREGRPRLGMRHRPLHPVEGGLDP